MTKSFLMRTVFLWLLLAPLAASAASLDDYYLAKFGEKTSLTGFASSGPVQADRCTTPLHKSLKRDWKLLAASTRETLAKSVSRPQLAGARTLSSPEGHFTIHYATTGTDAPLDLDANGGSAWVAKVAAVFDHVYDTEVTTMGFQSPVVPYDVYLLNLISQSAYGFTTDDGVPAFPSVKATSYIEIDKSFTSSIFTVDGTYTPEQLLDITAAHEFNHAIQYNYNYYFDMSYAEMTSTWMEDQVYDSVNQLYSYLGSYLPKTSTLSINAAEGGNSEYGRWIFNRFLSEAHPGSQPTDFVRNVWVTLGQTPATSDGSDLPMLTAIEATIVASGGTLSGDFLGFAKKLYRGDWTTHTYDDSLIAAAGLNLKATYSVYPVDTSAISTLAAALPGYTFAYYKFQPSSSAPTDLTLTFTNLPAWVDLVAIKKGTDGSFTEYPLNRAAGTVTVPSFNAAATAEVQLVVCNSTATVGAGTGTGSSGGSGSSGSSGGGCFIATAAYGSYLHPKVAELRAFRDRYLLTNAPGRLFVACYYRLSPPIARVIARHEWMMVAVRTGLTPVVLAVEHPAGALALLLLSAGALGGLVARRRKVLELCQADS